MNVSNLGFIVSLLFPPSFVICSYYFDFNSVTLAYTLLMLLYLIVSLVYKQSLKSISTPLIYFLFVLFAYMFSRIEFVKMIPALISGSFFLFFIFSFIQKKGIILSMTQRFYKKELNPEKQRFLASSDAYWAVIIFMNTLVQIGLVYYENNELWAFYSSIGWYIYLFIALAFQILYEKLFISSKLDAI